MDTAKNFVYGLVKTAPSPAVSGTTLVLDKTDYGDLFPDPATVGAYNIVIWATASKPLVSNAEIVRVTAKSDNVGADETTLTITRQQEDTSARTIVAGDQIALGVTAKTILDLQAGVLKSWISFTGAYASATSLTISGVDLTAIFKKGVLLKWVDSAGTTFKTGMVVSSSFSTNTTVNVVGSALASGDKNFYYNQLQYASKETFIIAGTFPNSATTDISKTFYVPEDIYVLSADLRVKTAGTGTGSNVVDINDDGTTKFTTKPTVTTGTSDLDNVADNPTTAVAKESLITVDVDSITATTAPVDGYIDLFYYPTSLVSRT